MSALANWYPGHRVLDYWVLDFSVIAAATVFLVTATAWMVSLFLKRHPAIRHGVLLLPPSFRKLPGQKGVHRPG